jgi:isopenicillin-N epimerase
LAIRAPLPPRRATAVKIAAFTLPLALWALLCFLWVPDTEAPVIERPDGLLLRTSTHFYNTEDEVDCLAEALAALLPS